QAEDGIRDFHVTGVQTCALPISTTLAKAAPLTAKDFPAGWKVHTEGRVRTLGPDSCGYRTKGPEAALGTGAVQDGPTMQLGEELDRKSTRLNSSHVKISYAVFCL